MERNIFIGCTSLKRVLIEDKLIQRCTPKPRPRQSLQRVHLSPALHRAYNRYVESSHSHKSSEAEDQAPRPVEPLDGPGQVTLSYSSEGRPTEVERVAIFSTSTEAALAAGVLEEAGIGCHLDDRLLTPYHMDRKVGLLVAPGAVPAAIERLAQTPARRCIVHESFDPVLRDPPERCACGSDNVQTVPRIGWIAGGAAVLLALLAMSVIWWTGVLIGLSIWGGLWLMHPLRHCRACGRRWNPRQTAAEPDEES